MDRCISYIISLKNEILNFKFLKIFLYIKKIQTNSKKLEKSSRCFRKRSEIPLYLRKYISESDGFCKDIWDIQVWNAQIYVQIIVFRTKFDVRITWRKMFFMWSKKSTNKMKINQFYHQNATNCYWHPFDNSTYDTYGNQK